MHLPRSDAAISPTGHVTGYTWVRAGWSDPALATATGRILYDALRPSLVIAGRLGLPTLDGMLLGRHRVIDTLLAEAIDDGRITQVIELASGLSPRGLTFTRRYPDLTYLEADLPGMTATKRRLLAKAGPLATGHRLVEVDAFADDGPTSLAGLAAPLDHDGGLAVITEGLVNYFATPSVTHLWERTAGVLRTFPSGLYLADIVLGSERPNRLLDISVAALSTFVRGRVNLHFAGSGEEGARSALVDAGFGEVDIRRVDRWPAAAEWKDDPGTKRAHVLAARVDGGAR